MDNTVSVYEKLELLHFTISEAINGNTGELSNALELVEDLREPYLRRKLMQVKITKEMVEFWLGTDTDIPELLSELANGEYKAKEFNQDIIDTWQEETDVKSS